MSRLIIATLLLTSCTAFQGPAFSIKPSATLLFAKKKGGTSTTGQGFGKAPAPKNPSQQMDDDAPNAFAPGSGLQNVEIGGSNAKPTYAPSDPNVPVGDRTKKILAEQYGLRTLEETRIEEKLAEQRMKFQRMKEEAERNEDFDLMAVLPAPLIIVIDRFLKIGLSICTVLFVASGVGIAAEAWAVTSKVPLPPDIDSFIVNIIEPNFTPGLLVLLGFSVSLGIFASAQLGSSGSVYSEDP
jgi:hypothetical protein